MAAALNMSRITFQWIEPCRSERLRQAQQVLQASIEALGLEPDRFAAGPAMVKFANILRQARTHSTGDAFVWCNSDVILRKNPFSITDRTKVHGFHRTELPSGEICHGVDMYLIPHAIWDNLLANDIPDLWCGAAAVDWWITRRCQKLGIYENHSGFIDHPSHERSAASAGGDRYSRDNLRAYNRWARRHGLGTLEEPIRLPGLGVWNNSIRDWWLRQKNRPAKTGG